MPFTVRVQNFQSIEDATIYVDGLTVLTGTNNTGKSALFRALRGAFTNARGHGYVRNGTTHCTVDIDFQDTMDLPGGVLQWEKGPKGVNRYKVGPLTLSKVGHGPPAEVQALGVRSLKVGDEVIWPQIASQISGVQFLLDKSPPVLAEALADVERVNLINRSLRNCEADRKDARSNLKSHEEMLQSLTAQTVRFAALDQDLALLREIEREHAELTKLQAKIQELESLRRRMQVSQDVLKALAGLEAVLLPSDDEVAQLRRLHQALVALAELSQRLTKARENARRYENGQNLEAIQAALLGLQEPLRQLEQSTVQIRQLEQHQLRQNQILAELRAHEQGIEATRKAHRQAEEAAKAALGSFSECPTCGGKFT